MNKFVIHIPLAGGSEKSGLVAVRNHGQDKGEGRIGRMRKIKNVR